MSVITATLSDLKRRRLLPVVALLLGALVGIPVVLSKDPKPVAAAVPPAPKVTAAADTAFAKPVVTLDQDHTTLRRTLGSRKDPFAPAPLPKAKAAPTATTTSTTGPAAAAGAGSTSAAPAVAGPGGSSATITLPTGGSSTVSTPSSGSTGGTGTTTTDPVKAPAPRFPANSITVRFGDATADDLSRSTIEGLAPLPDADAPVVVFLGLQDKGRMATFLLDDGVVADGDGTCRPDPQTCDTFTLRSGETEFLDVTDADGKTTQYELDLVAIHPAVAKASASSKASAARAVPTAAHADEAGATATARVARAAEGDRAVRRFVRRRAQEAQLRVAYDARTGTVAVEREPAWHQVVERIVHLGL